MDAQSGPPENGRVGKGPRWTAEEDRLLLALAPSKTVREISLLVSAVWGYRRSYFAVTARAALLGITLRTGAYVRATTAVMALRKPHGCGARPMRDFDPDDGEIFRCLLCGWQAPIQD